MNPLIYLLADYNFFAAPSVFLNFAAVLTAFTALFSVYVTLLSLRQASKTAARLEISNQKLMSVLAELSKGAAAEIEKQASDRNESHGLTNFESKGDSRSDLQDSLQGLVQSAYLSSASSAKNIKQVLNSLSLEARALITVIANSRHIDLHQYRQLRDSADIGPPLRELRASGLLAPVVSASGQEVYYLPSALADVVRRAVRNLPVPASLQQRTQSQLHEIGYPVRKVPDK